MYIEPICYNKLIGIDDGVLIGDSGYPCKTYLLTPFDNPVGRSQRKYNRHLKCTRSSVERTIGRWKRRFHLLHSEVIKTKEITLPFIKINFENSNIIFYYDL